MMDFGIVSAGARADASDKIVKSLTATVDAALDVLVERNVRMFVDILENRIKNTAAQGEYEVRYPVAPTDISYNWRTDSRYGEPTLESVGIKQEDYDRIFQNTKLKREMWQKLFSIIIDTLKREYEMAGFKATYEYDHFTIDWEDR